MSESMTQNGQLGLSSREAVKPSFRSEKSGRQQLFGEEPNRYLQINARQAENHT
jgi:hypothetical protein